MKSTRVAINKIIQEVFGEEVMPVTKLLNEHEEISEIKIANLLEVEVNEARKILYKLYQENVVSFKKKKDLENGWYTYYWSFNHGRIPSIVNKVLSLRLDKLNNKLNVEKETQYYLCPYNCMRLTIENAMNYHFKCPECGNLMEHHDNTKTISNLQSNINSIKAYITQYS